jgi:hypothetical protein
MIKVGTLCRRIHASQNLCQVVSIYNHRDIDPECPESVAIIGMVKFVLLSGDDIGRTFKQKRADFNYRWEIIDGEEGVSQ